MSFNKSQGLRLIVYDFDGVMTDNRVFLFADGSESVMVHRGDGFAVKLIKGLSIEQLILSSERNTIVATRGKKLGIPVLHGVENKLVSLEKYCLKQGYDLEKVAFVGNDLNDLECMRKVRWAIAPADAHPQIKSIAYYMTHSKGGHGVIREIADLLIGSQAR